MTEDFNDEDLHKLRAERRKHLQELRDNDKTPYAKKYSPENKAQEIKENFSNFQAEEVSIAGRMMAFRSHGKASFADLQDFSGKIQLYLKYDILGEKNYEFFQDLDIGDIIGVKGEVFKTNRGEVTVKVKEFELLTKSLRPLPEKFHGLKDKDLRYRRRYLDLIVNPEVKDTFVKRSKIIRSMRNYLEDKGFLEVETPMMHPIVGGANARPFVTHHNALDMDLYLRIAPELYLKRLIVGGMEKVFEINRNFRNEGMSYKHNPEFTMMELYEAYADYHDMMELTEELVEHISQEILDTTTIEYEGQEIDLSTPWQRMTMIEAIEEYTGIDFGEIDSVDKAYKAADNLGLEPEDDLSIGEIIHFIFEERVEEELIQPVFIKDYPIEVSPLARRKENNHNLTYRFEPFICGREIGNAFTELNDPVEQRRRFEEQVSRREEGDEEAHMMDEDYIRALEYGMPPTGGLGIGVDRLVMLLTDSSSIREVILFPTMRPESREE